LTAPPHTPPPSGASTPDGLAHDQLRSRRDELAEQVVELHWDLGGLAYEMAIRDHFRLDVLVRRVGGQPGRGRHAELAEIERLLRLEEGASAGVCPACGAPHSRGALFCWQCGGALMERARSSALPAQSAEQERGPALPAQGAEQERGLALPAQGAEQERGPALPAQSAEQEDTVALDRPGSDGLLADAAAAAALRE
jgi:hypothetical protein